MNEKANAVTVACGDIGQSVCDSSSGLRDTDRGWRMSDSGVIVTRTILPSPIGTAHILARGFNLWTRRDGRYDYNCFSAIIPIAIEDLG